MDAEGVGVEGDPPPPQRPPLSPLEAFGSGGQRPGGFDAVAGAFGRRQRLVCGLTCLPLPLAAATLLSGTFYTLEPPHRCRGAAGGAEGAAGGAEGTEEGSCHLNDTDQRLCPNGWVYRPQLGLQNNIITQWDLVCDSAWEPCVEEICFILGCLSGYLFLGYLSDRMGRRATCLLSLVLSILFGIAVSVAPNVTVFTLARFGDGAAIAGLLLSLYLIRLELCGPCQRLPMAVVAGVCGCGGQLAVLGLAVVCRQWRLLQGVITAPLGLFLLYCCPRLLPESPRWLLAVGRVTEAKTVLGAILENGRRDRDHDREPLEEEEAITELDCYYPGTHDGDQRAICKLLKCRNIWKNILILGFTAFIAHGIHHCYGTFRHDVLGTRSGFYLVYLLSVGTGAASCLFLWATVDRCGRRGILLLSMTLTGLASLILLGLTEYLNEATILALSTLGLFSSHSASVLSIFFASEIIPTVTRGLGLGLVLGLSSLSGLGQPLLDLQGRRGYFLQHVLFASLALLAIVSLLLLPESKRKALPDTLAQGERYRRPALLAQHRDHLPLLPAPSPDI